MKNGKLLKKVAATIVCSSMALTAFAFTACGSSCGGHKHTYAEEWTYNGTQHWRIPTCGDTDEVGFKAPHTWGEDDKCTVCDATWAVLKPTLSEADDDDPVPGEDGKVDITYTLNVSDLQVQTTTADITKNVFTVSKGTEIRERKRTSGDLNFKNSVKMGSGSVIVNAGGAGTLTVYVENGTTGATAAAILVNGQSYEYPATAKAVQKVEIEINEAGDYEITRDINKNSTTDLYYATFETRAAVTAVEKIEVEDGGKTDYYVGQTFDASSLKVNAVYETTGTIKAVSLGRLTVDYSAFESSRSGVYTIKLSYVKGGRTYVAEYDVTVYELEGLTYSTHLTNGTKQTTFKQIYLKDEEFSAEGLTVTATTKCGDKSATFKLSPERYTISAPDLSSVGEKTVTVTSNDVSTVKIELKVYVVEKAEAVNNQIAVSVDASKPISPVNFHTVTQALTYLENYDAAVVKTINIADGVYKEKISVNIPNVHLIGSKTNKPSADTDNGAVLMYDAISGKTDASGKNYGTNGSGTVTVTSAATGFVAQNITFKNYYNTNALYNESLNISSDSQACALVVESASASFFNCKMSGYHDTLYSNKGKHYYEKCWIEGRTDYIFGSDANAYFKKCTIYTLSAGSQDNNGGYVCALKPSASSYYFVFNGCEFTGADECATDIALGRAWGTEMKTVIMNSVISGNYSVNPHTFGTAKKQRYCTMSGNEPKAENMLEYNNTGAGAVSESIALTCTYMTQTQAAEYDTDKITAILGFTPLSPEAETFDVTVKDGSENALCTLKIESGDKLTLDALYSALSKTEYSRYDIEGVYTDANFQNAYATDSVVNGALTVYVKLVEGPFSKDTAISFKEKDPSYEVRDPNSTKYIGKLKVESNSGTFVMNNDWYKLTGDATISLLLKADTVVAVKAYDDSLQLTFNGEPVNCKFVSGTYTVDLREAGTLVISKKATSSQGYIGSVNVDCDAGLSMTKSTVTLYCGSAVVGTLSVYNDTKIEKEQLDALLKDYSLPDGKEFEGYYSDAACSSAYDFNSAIAGATPIYIGLKEASAVIGTNTTISFGSGGNYESFIDSGKLIAVNDSGNVFGQIQSNCNQLNNGTSLKITVSAGATVHIDSYANYTHYTVKIDGTVVTPTEITATTYQYHADADCVFELVSAANNYIYNIKVLYISTVTASTGKVYEYAAPITDSEYISSSNLAENNDWAKFGDDNAYVLLYVEANVTLTFTVYDNTMLSVNGDDEAMVTVDKNTLTYSTSEAEYLLIKRKAGTSAYFKLITATAKA